MILLTVAWCLVMGQLLVAGVLIGTTVTAGLFWFFDELAVHS